MPLPTLPGTRLLLRNFFNRDDPDRYLWHCRGVVHVGANAGAERKSYAEKLLGVLWVEPIPEVFRQLEQNLHGLRDQRAVQALVTDRDGEKIELNISSGNMASSSIFELHEHRKLWPRITMERKIPLTTTTLPTLFKDCGFDASDFDALVVDTQGSELLVLRGAEPMLGGFKYIKTEAADFEAYKGCCRLEDISIYLLERGFIEVSRDCFKTHADDLNYYDVLYRRSDYRPVLPFRLPRWRRPSR